MKKNIEIHSIESIERRSLQPFLPNTILISFGDTDSEPPTLNNKPDHILQLTFDDITLHEVKSEFDIPESIASSDEKLIEFLQVRGVTIFNDNIARQIAKFIITRSKTQMQRIFANLRNEL